ncbi:hypothetical protein AB0D46_27035 [Streptomyces sp. NPDC048383]
MADGSFAAFTDAVAPRVVSAQDDIVLGHALVRRFMVGEGRRPEEA